MWLAGAQTVGIPPGNGVIPSRVNAEWFGNNIGFINRLRSIIKRRCGKFSGCRHLQDGCAALNQSNVPTSSIRNHRTRLLKVSGKLHLRYKVAQCRPHLGFNRDRLIGVANLDGHAAVISLWRNVEEIGFTFTLGDEWFLILKPSLCRIGLPGRICFQVSLHGEGFRVWNDLAAAVTIQLGECITIDISPGSQPSSQSVRASRRNQQQEKRRHRQRNSSDPRPTAVKRIGNGIREIAFFQFVVDLLNGCHD